MLKIGASAVVLVTASVLATSVTTDNCAGGTCGFPPAPALATPTLDSVLLQQHHEKSRRPLGEINSDLGAADGLEQQAQPRDIGAVLTAVKLLGAQLQASEQREMRQREEMLEKVVEQMRAELGAGKVQPGAALVEQHQQLRAQNTTAPPEVLEVQVEAGKMLHPDCTAPQLPEPRTSSEGGMLMQVVRTKGAQPTYVNWTFYFNTTEGAERRVTDKQLGIDGFLNKFLKADGKFISEGWTPMEEVSALSPTEVTVALFTPHVQAAVARAFSEYVMHLRVRAGTRLCNMDLPLGQRLTGERLPVDLHRLAVPVERCQLAFHDFPEVLDRVISAAAASGALTERPSSYILDEAEVEAFSEEYESWRARYKMTMQGYLPFQICLSAAGPQYEPFAAELTREMDAYLGERARECHRDVDGKLDEPYNDWHNCLLWTVHSVYGRMHKRGSAAQQLREARQSAVDSIFFGVLGSTGCAADDPASALGLFPSLWPSFKAAEQQAPLDADAMTSWRDDHPEAWAYVVMSARAATNTSFALEDRDVAIGGVPLRPPASPYTRRELCDLLAATDGGMCSACTTEQDFAGAVPEQWVWGMWEEVSPWGMASTWEPGASGAADRRACWEVSCLLRELCTWADALELGKVSEPCPETTKYEQEACAMQNAIQGQTCASSSFWSAGQRSESAHETLHLAIQAAHLDQRMTNIEIKLEQNAIAMQELDIWFDAAQGLIEGVFAAGGAALFGPVGAAAAGAAGQMISGAVGFFDAGLQQGLLDNRSGILDEQEALAESIRVNQVRLAEQEHRERMIDSSDKLTEGLCRFWSEEACNLPLTTSHYQEALARQGRAQSSEERKQHAAQASEQRDAIAKQLTDLNETMVLRFSELDAALSAGFPNMTANLSEGQDAIRSAQAAMGDKLTTMNETLNSLTLATGGIQTDLQKIGADLNYTKDILHNVSGDINNLTADVADLRNITQVKFTEVLTGIRGLAIVFNASAEQVVEDLTGVIRREVLANMVSGFEKVSDDVATFKIEFHLAVDSLQEEHSRMTDLLVANTIRLDELKASVEANTELAEAHQVEDHIIQVYVQMGVIEAAFNDMLDLTRRRKESGAHLLRTVLDYEQCQAPLSQLVAAREKHTEADPESAQALLLAAYRRQRNAMAELATVIRNGRVMRRLVEEAVLSIAGSDITQLPAFSEGGCRSLFSPAGIQQLGEVLRNASEATLTKHAAQLWHTHEMVEWSRMTFLRAGAEAPLGTDILLARAWQSIVEEVQGMVHAFEHPHADESKELLLLYHKLLDRLLPTVCPAPPACVAAVLQVAPGTDTTELVAWDRLALAGSEDLISVVARPQALLSAGAQSGWEVDVRQPIPATIVDFDGNLPDRVFTCALTDAGTYNASRPFHEGATALPDSAFCFCSASVWSDEEGQAVIGQECHHSGTSCQAASPLPIDTWSPARRPWPLPGLAIWTRELKTLHGGACGDGVLQLWEACDEGTAGDSQGCEQCLLIRTGFHCHAPGLLCETVCGDGILAGNEQCDDGNQQDADGCSASCQLEAQCARAPAGHEYVRRLPGTNRPLLTVAVAQDLGEERLVNGTLGSAVAAAVRDLSWAVAPCSTWSCPQGCAAKAERQSLLCHGTVCSASADAERCCDCGAPCSTLQCPDGFVPIQGAEPRFCQGQACSAASDADLATCCEEAGPMPACTISGGGASTKTCAVGEDQRVYCWNLISELEPLASEIAAWSDVTAVSVGMRAVCAIVSGTVKCAGDFQWYEGVWPWPGSSDTDPPADVTDAVAVSSGCNSGCLLTVAGAVRCWGRGGDANVNVAVPPDLPPATAIWAGCMYTCALDIDGYHHCWGQGRRLSWEADAGAQGIPALASRPYLTLALGWHELCGVGAEDGKPYCEVTDHWRSHVDYRARPAPPADLKPLRSLSFSGPCLSALDLEGTFRWWGDNCVMLRSDMSWKPGLPTDGLRMLNDGLVLDSNGTLHWHGLSSSQSPVPASLKVRARCPMISAPSDAGAALLASATAVGAGLEPCFSWTVGTAGAVPSVNATQASCGGASAYSFVVFHGQNTLVRHDIQLGSTQTFEDALHSPAVQVPSMPSLTLRTTDTGNWTLFGLRCAGSSALSCRLWEVPLGANASEASAMEVVTAAFGASQRGGIAATAAAAVGGASSTFAIYKFAGAAAPWSCDVPFVAACGDGLVSGAEECDDEGGGGGCDEQCRVPAGWACSGAGGPGSCHSCEPAGKINATGFCEAA